VDEAGEYSMKIYRHPVLTIIGYARRFWWGVIRSEYAQRRKIIRDEVAWSGKGLSQEELDEFIAAQRYRKRAYKILARMGLSIFLISCIFLFALAMTALLSGNIDTARRLVPIAIPGLIFGTIFDRCAGDIDID
jgi:hypothetical protein